MAYNVPKNHVCNPPLGKQDDQRWRCVICRKQYWYNARTRRWELVL